VGQYIKEVMKLAGDERDAIAEKNRRIADRVFEHVDDPTKTFVPPKPEKAAPFLNFAPLQNALSRLDESTKNYDAAMRDSGARLQSLDVQIALDNALRQVELTMITEGGLPRRPWFKHQIYAPGFYTGYGVKTLPGIREAIEQHRWEEASEQIGVVAGTLEKTATQIDRATAVLK
jgi:N-acetylated-alpha-linked acidic dipeptidase